MIYWKQHKSKLIVTLLAGGTDKDILLAKDFHTAWTQHGGHIPIKRTANGYEISYPVPVRNPYKARRANYGWPLAYAHPTQIIPSPQRMKEHAALNEWHRSASAAFHRCLHDLESWALTARYG
jgi:hypothetical protein